MIKRSIEIVLWENGSSTHLVQIPISGAVAKRILELKCNKPTILESLLVTVVSRLEDMIRKRD